MWWCDDDDHWGRWYDSATPEQRRRLLATMAVEPWNRKDTIAFTVIILSAVFLGALILYLER